MDETVYDTSWVGWTVLILLLAWIGWKIVVAELD
jgi:hypothetical protein